MLKGIDPILGPDLLHCLRSMGHGDEIVIADANFPAASIARRLLRADGLPAPRIAQALASVMPLDPFVPVAAFRMAVVGNPDSVPTIASEFAEILAANGYRGPLQPLERAAFYDRTREAFAVIATGETRLYGNLILKKGVIGA